MGPRADAHWAGLLGMVGLRSDSPSERSRVLALRLVQRPHADRFALLRVIVTLASALVGCGGGAPLGHPAHVLSAGKATIGAGVAGTFAMESSPTVPASVARLRDMAIAPDVSPWVAARAGFGGGFEGGLGATTRALRVDARRAFELWNRSWALSVGMGASALLAAPPRGAATGVYGVGLDIPVVLGWRSRADLYSIWAGPRLGGEILSGQLDLSGVATTASGRSLNLGGVVGLRAGLRHLYAVVELDFAYRAAEGTVGPEAVSVRGVTLTPFGGLVVSF